MLALGLAAAAAPFFLSLGPSATAGASLLHIDISSLREGDYFYFAEDPSWNHADSKYLLIKLADNDVHVYWLPTSGNRFVMPDMHWFRLTGGFCDSFGPDTANGGIVKEGVIQCHDNHPPDAWSTEWRWTYSGKNLGHYTDDLRVPDFTIEGHDVVIGKRNRHP